jgi:nucleotide-binding universal stress UspA family protein
VKEREMSAAVRNGIIVGVDGSPASHAAISWATRDAVMRNVPLILVHAINLFAATWPESPEVEEVAIWQEDAGRRILDDAFKIANDSMQSGRSIPIERELIFSRAVPTLVELSRRAECLVVGNRGRGALARSVLGSVSTSVVRHAHCPVAVVRHPAEAKSDQRHAPVLLGIDGSPASELATAIAFDEASRRGVALVAVHAWTDIVILELPGLDWSAVKAEEQRSLTERLAGWQERYPDVEVHSQLICDRAAHVIVQKSKSAQLVVLGSHGRGAAGRTLLGSVSNAVLQSVHAPIIVARP